MDADSTVALVSESERTSDEVRQHAEQLGVKFLRVQRVEQLQSRLDPTGAGCILLDDHDAGELAISQHRWLVDRGFCQPCIVLIRNVDLVIAVSALRAGMRSVEKALDLSSRLPSVLVDALEFGLKTSAQARRVTDTLRRLNTLAAGEVEVLRGMLDGKLNKSVAVQLGISERTVEARRKRIFDKLDTKSIACLTRLIVETIGFDEFMRCTETTTSSVPAPHFRQSAGGAAAKQLATPTSPTEMRQENFQPPHALGASHLGPIAPGLHVEGPGEREPNAADSTSESGRSDDDRQAPRPPA